MYIASLNSGSNANCYYVGTKQDAILVDAGLSCRETEKRIRRLGLDMDRIRGIFISHEHSDHINGLATLSNKFRLPVYITRGTQAFGKAWVDKKFLNRFTPHQAIGIGEMSVTAFPKFHDAGDPHSFIISSGYVRVGVFTDIGRVCKQVITHFRQCHAAFLEANYDEDMLVNGAYPALLKKRIMGGDGHLSNAQALELFRKHRPPFMTHLVLSHLSHNNNHPDIVSRLFQPYQGHVNICIASRFEETELFEVRADANVSAVFATPVAESQQLRLFEEL
jgi:phosphoribosyl 1,2-cyclic phosphodiesterase